jgi:hypothetical protein
MQNTSQMAYWQKQPNRAIQNYTFHRSWILHFKKRLAKYSMKTMAADKGMIKV